MKNYETRRDDLVFVNQIGNLGEPPQTARIVELARNARSI